MGLQRRCASRCEGVCVLRTNPQQHSSVIKLHTT